MNDMVVKTSGALAVAEKNPFEMLAEQAERNRLIGDRLKYAKGDWLSGKDDAEVARGTRVVVDIANMYHGWICWKDKKPVDARMGRVADYFIIPARDTLGDQDQSLWELNQDGKPSDPWNKTNQVVMKAEKGDQLYTYSTSSVGGFGALAKLSGEYGKRVRAKPNELPIVELETDSYAHKDKTRGRVKFPVFKVVGWVDRGALDTALGAEAAAAEAASEADEFDAPF